MMKDKKGNERKLKDLQPGAHFGEISLIYGCKRTASVISGNYSTFAKLSFDKYKELTQFIPELQSALKGYIDKYNDPVK